MLYPGHRSCCAIAVAVFAQVAAAEPAVPASPPRMSEVLAEAERADHADDYRRLGELMEQLVQRGVKNPSAAYRSAAGYALAGDRDRAFAMLETAVVLGFHHAELLASDPPFAALHDDARWVVAVSRAEAASRAYQAAHADPARAKIVASDVPLFWRAYGKLATAADPAAVLDLEYLEAGSLGLQDFVPGRIGSGARLHEVIQKHPRYFAAIRDNTLAATQVEPEIRKAFGKLKAIYPAATFPDVYFVVGALTAGGTSTMNGLVIGMDMVARGPGVPMDEMDDWHKVVINRASVLPSLVAHELIHFQQKPAGRSLLACAFNEGAADFVASLISSGNFNEQLYIYGYAHERELWKEFQVERSAPDHETKWLYGGTPKHGRPADLGYFMGFRIAQAYYQRAKDKPQALRDIIRCDDPDKLLAASHYGESFAAH